MNFKRILKQLIALLILTGLVLSCTYFVNNTEKATIPVVDTIIDFNSVDVFPLFPSCDSIPSEEKQKICSQIKLSEQLYASLLSYNLVISEKINDTIFIKLHVDNKGNVSLVNMKFSDLVKNQIPNIDSIVEIGVGKLPKMSPGLKRGIPVTTEFTLPIVLKN
ncbi:hypothetical protein [uncultured Lutibacter sp.]|uniref:hypothetical protein n=1 Tax=uncultured Lutibacter sp. TaxID=437739 RepID=UPI0026388CB8|nr:hypothetical protein [uncultured Lutibacter sp.]